ncbi:uncharacterized protein PFLUO_LOCUS991 [Penicillium psychrofluorescens]|uniref:uncharacterized protein n=1 Tax=Penicillium psychrofluorescens TaxID=3158075 RepID=UPI003CCE2AFC
MRVQWIRVRTRFRVRIRVRLTIYNAAMGPRRSHRKSRNGCRECKTRRLKCDERYPCTNCIKHGIPCSYVAPVEPSDASPAPSTPAELPAGRSQPSQPQSQVTTPSGLAAWTAASSENRADLLDLLCTSPEDAPSKEDWALDLELMHHFSTVTCNTLAIRPDVRHTWQSVVPVEAYSNEYVMHGLLAIAAMHRSYLYPAQRDRYTKASAYHQAAGLKEFRDLIASPIDPSNWQPVFCFASMITVHVCALPLRLGVDRWPAPISNMVEVFSVMTGFQTIMEPFMPLLRKTQWAPFVFSVWIEDEKMPAKYMDTD